MKIGFLFPGQGSQSLNMGNDLYKKYEKYREVYEKVKELTGIDIKKITFEDEEKLNQTKYTQLAILTMSLAILEILKENGISANAAAGLSLGEYTALINSGKLDFDAGIKLVQKRGELMQELCPKGDWKMAAILGLDEENVIKACESVEKGFVKPANFNTIGQIVISGEREAVEEAGEKAKELGAKKVMILNTSGPFHTEKLKEASDELKKELKNVKFNKFEMDVVKNLDGKIYSEKDDMVEILAKHITNPVRFVESIQNMVENDVDVLVEIGPGKVLSGFAKKIESQKEIKILNINNIDTLEKTIEILKGE